MRIGKVKANMLDRSVLRPIRCKTADGSPSYGEDAGSILLHGRKENRICIQTNPVEGWTLAAERCVYGAINSLSAAGASAESLAVTILLPPSAREKQLKVLMNRLNDLCLQEGLSLMAGHTAFSKHVDTLVMSVTGVGFAREKVNPKNMRPGLDLVMTGYAASEGAARIALEKEDELKKRFMLSYIKDAQELYEAPCCKTAAQYLYDAGAVYVHDLHEGGTFAGLWELAASGHVGLEVWLKQIPIKQHAIEVCEFFNLNPYMLYSGGCLIAAVDNGKDVAMQLEDKGIKAAVIGRIIEGNDKIVYYDDETRYLEPPKPDSYYDVDA